MKADISDKPSADDLWAGALVLFLLVSYFALSLFALWYVFTHWGVG